MTSHGDLPRRLSFLLQVVCNDLVPMLRRHGGRCQAVHGIELSAPRRSKFPLVGAVLVGQHDEWVEGRRYLGLDVLARAATVGTTPADEPVQLSTELPELEPAA